MMKRLCEAILSPLSPGQRDAGRQLLYMLLLAAAYFAAAQFGLCMAEPHQEISVFWPSSGIALAALLLLGIRLWPGVLLGAFLTELNLHQPVLSGFGIAAGNMLEALAGVWLLHRFACKEKCMESLKGVFGLLFLASFLSTFISALDGAVILCLNGSRPWSSFGEILMVWWFGNAGGVLIITPLILAWAQEKHALPSLRRLIQTVALWTVAVVCGILIFVRPLAFGDVWIYPYMAFPIITLAALVFGARTVTLMIFGICGTTLWAAAHHAGLSMVMGSLASLPFGRYSFVVQSYTMAVATVGLIVQASISERRIVEEQLHKSRAYLQKVIDHIPDPILIKDKQRILHGGNKALWEILNQPPDILIGKNCDHVFANKEEADAFNARYEEVFKTGKTDVSEEVFTDHQGQAHTMSLKVALIQSDGMEPSLVAIAHDITDLKKTEDRLRQYTVELENSNRELDDFAYIASHDLKEPLRGMQSFSQFVIEDYGDKLDDEGKRKLRAISDLTKRLDNLLNVLLQYSRLGRTALAMGNVNIGDIARSSVGLLAISLKEKNVTMEIAPEWPVINCDRVRIGEVFQNLIGNALKYTDKPENRIEIGYTTDHPRAPGEYAFYVRDHGIGIPEKFLDSIFKIFKRLHAKEAYGGGTGSGLAIVKKIIQQHGGRVWAESKGEGQGTTFYFTLPQKK